MRVAMSAVILAVVGGNLSAAESSVLPQIFDPEMIGADIAYLERLTGPARNTYGQTKVYKISGCEVSVAMIRGTVGSVGMAVSPQCDFDLSTFLPNLRSTGRPLHTLTFGQFDAMSGGTGRYYEDCLYLCGNATDPRIYQHWQGSRADKALEVLLEVAQVDEPAVEAAFAWKAGMMEAEGEDWVLDAKFNCTQKYEEVAHRLFREVRISKITIGYDIEIPRCES